MFGRGLKLLSALRSPPAREHAWRTIESYNQLPDTTCPCCGFTGKFDSFGLRARLGANCPSCESKERHRLFALAMQRGFISFAGCDVIHFAPEGIVRRMVTENSPASYRSADLTPGVGDLVLNLEAIDLPAGSVDRIVCSHVLEHVDDAKALAEMRRILRPGGYAVLLVPLIEGWDDTFEDPSITAEAERELYFGQYDHVRYYGRDVRQRIVASGLELAEYTAGPRDTPRHGLSHGEKIFRATKAA